MSSRRYLNFDLLLEQRDDGEYEALVTASPLGETPSVGFRLPFADATVLENLLLKLDPGRSGTRRAASGPDQAVVDFGGPLFSAVFRDEVLLCWSRSQDLARQQEAGLRLRLRLDDAPAIAGLPWELLYDARSNVFPAQSERTPLVRFLDVPQVPRPMTVDGPLRVLVVISSPVDLVELDVEAEWRRTRDALAPRVESGLVVVDRLPAPTVSGLGSWLRRHETHVIHFVGHGDFDAGLQEGVVYFQDRHGRASAVGASVLGPYARDHDPLRMVLLNACRSARGDAADPFAGLAQGLVRQDVTAVVAMQFPITDRAAVTFTGEFYGALVDGFPVDQAVTSARKALLADFRDEWATPVLFMRSPDGEIFEQVRSEVTAPGPAPESVPEPVPVPEPDPAPERASAPVPLAAPGSSAAPAPDAAPAPEAPGRLRRALAPAAGRRTVLGLGAGVVALGLLAWWLVPWPGGDDGGSSSSSAVEALPRSTPLSADQLLLATGPTRDQQHVWLVDRADPGGSRQLTDGPTREWLPVLSQDRRTMIYSRLRAGTRGDYQLRVAGAADGSGDRPLFAQPPEECAADQGRPAWSPTDPDVLVMTCRALNGGRHLVYVDLEGSIQHDQVLTDARGTPLLSVGDPTYSPDGQGVVLWGSTEAGASGGSLYAFDPGDDTTVEVLAAERPGQYSDPAFSPDQDGALLAYRSDEGGGNYDIMFSFPRTDSDGRLRPLTPLPLVTEPGRDEDPTFSPDGTQVAYVHTAPDHVAQRTWTIAVSSRTPERLLAEPLGAVDQVPAWSTR